MITARDLFCLYPVPAGTVTALRGLSLSVPAGERLVVHGPNGSGKTTLLKVLMGEQAPSAGTVEVAGVDLGGADERTRARLRLTRLGIVDQHSARALRPELTVLDNVALQVRVAGARRTAARQAAADVLASFGLDGLAERRPASLAGGEAQRIAVCAALAHHPAVVLADEPTGDLDTDTADAVYDLLAAAVARAGATLLLVSHDTRAARIADRVVRIRDGRLSEQWAPAEPEDEILVVDDRGWVRLPEQLRQRTGAAGGVRAAGHGDRIVLSAVHDGPGRSGPGRPLDAVPPRTPGAVVACAL